VRDDGIVSPQFSDELRVLRERAYGPTADIQDDPAALTRLRELEELSRTEAAEPAQPPAAPAEPPAPPAVERVTSNPAPSEAAWHPSPPSTTFPGADADAGADADTIPAAETPADGIPTETQGEPQPATADQTAPKPWWRRRVTLVWAGSLLITALIAIGATLWAVQAQGRVAILQPADVSEWPDQVLGEAPENARVFDEYLGLMVVIMPQAWGPGDAMDCLYVLESSRQGFMSTIGCAAGAFPPSAALAVSDNAPDELRARHPDGTALQFVLEGDQVHVYAKQP
jgi:hypothetical protein